MEKNQEKETVQEPQNVNETVNEQQPLSKPTLVIGTTEKSVATYLKGYCTKKNMEFIQMKDEELHAYLKKVDPKYKDGIQYKSLKAFVESKENRQEAYKQAVKLFTILAPKADIEYAGNFEFSSTDAVRSTTLSHKQFKQFFELCELFHLVQKTDKNRFKFTFDKNDQRIAIQNGIFSLVRATVSDIARYNANIDADDSMNEEEKNEVKKILLDKILGELQ